MAGLMDKIRGRDATSTGATSTGQSIDNAATTAESDLSNTSMAGTGSTTQYDSTATSTQGGYIQEAYDGVAKMSAEARVRFTGQPTTTNVTSQSSANTVEIPAQTVSTTLPAKRVVVEVPERQVEVQMPARHVQLENNPEIEVHTRPSIRAVAGEIVSEVTGGAYGGSGVPSATGGASDPTMSTGKY